MKRENGFYWVKSIEDKWEVAEWVTNGRGVSSWLCISDETPYKDEFFKQIDERRLQHAE